MADPKEVKNDTLALPDFSKFVEEQIGFAPYWNPEEDKWFYGRVVSKDERDPDFTRYLFQAGMDLKCKRGPVEEAEDVEVKKGEYFSISVYFALRELFDLYLETDHRPFIKVIAVKEVPTKTKPNTVWLWKVLTDPKDKKLLDQKRQEIKTLREKSDAEEFPPKKNNQLEQNA